MTPKQLERAFRHYGKNTSVFSSWMLFVGLVLLAVASIYNTGILLTYALVSIVLGLLSLLKRTATISLMHLVVSSWFTATFVTAVFFISLLVTQFATLISANVLAVNDIDASPDQIRTVAVITAIISGLLLPITLAALYRRFNRLAANN